MLYPIFNQRMKYKNIFLTGSTGVVGKPLLEKLINEGHNVYALSRNKINDKFLISNNTEIIRGDLFDDDIYSHLQKKSFNARQLPFFKQLYRVSAGKFSNKKNAVEYQKQIKKKLHISSWILIKYRNIYLYIFCRNSWRKKG